MNSGDIYSATCSCENVRVTMTGMPKVRGTCHCGDCRELLNVPYHAVNAWEKDKVTVVAGEGSMCEFSHPRLNMKKFFCSNCGDVIFNSNALDWRVFSQHFLTRSYGGELPLELQSKSHFFYGRRIVNIDDDLPKRE